ncbi:hypothetical protein ACN4EG_23145 [Alkalinema pantanalense CENA528]|uniref:hypothetical protein n=1 Tax=Alkalinema pantanalense TaxID=1620705 RepID=UPI003D6E341D
MPITLWLILAQKWARLSKLWINLINVSNQLNLRKKIVGRSAMAARLASPLIGC